MPFSTGMLSRLPLISLAISLVAGLYCSLAATLLFIQVGTIWPRLNELRFAAASSMGRIACGLMSMQRVLVT